MYICACTFMKLYEREPSPDLHNSIKTLNFLIESQRIESLAIQVMVCVHFMNDFVRMQLLHLQCMSLSF